MIKIETTSERIESQGGMYLAGIVAQKIGLTSITSGVLKSAANTICAIYATLIQGNTGFEAVKLVKGNSFYNEAFGINLNYSENTTRLYFERISVDSFVEVRNQLINTSFNLLNMATISSERVGKTNYFIIDGDTTPMDNSKSNKECVSYTYKGFDGFQPMFLFVGTEGYMLDCELRPGSQHCQEGTPEMLKLNRNRIKHLAGGRPSLYRLDSGNDSIDTIKAIIRDSDDNVIPNQFFIIKRNLRMESKDAWLDFAKANGEIKEKERDGKTRWTGKKLNKHPTGLDDVYCVYEVIERTTDHDNTPLLIHKVEVNTWWTNMKEDADTIIDLYHKHGTMEQFHSELKCDMGVERLPSSKFIVNELYMMVVMNAYNTLRFIGQEAKKVNDLIPIKTKSFRMRLGKVLQNIIGIAIKFVRHAKNHIIKIYEENPWQKLFSSSMPFFNCFEPEFGMMSTDSGITDPAILE